MILVCSAISWFLVLQKLRFPGWVWHFICLLIGSLGEPICPPSMMQCLLLHVLLQYSLYQTSLTMQVRLNLAYHCSNHELSIQRMIRAIGTEVNRRHVFLYFTGKKEIQGQYKDEWIIYISPVSVISTTFIACSSKSGYVARKFGAHKTNETNVPRKRTCTHENWCKLMFNMICQRL